MKLTPFAIKQISELVEELLTSFNSFVAQMRALADRGTDKG